MMNDSDRQAVLQVLKAANNNNDVPENNNEMETIAKMDAHGRVIKLQLKTCIELQSLPPEIGDLVELRELCLYWCRNLTTLPKEIERLENTLQVLHLCWCNHLTVLPPEMGRLTQLQRLVLTGSSQMRHLPKEIWDLTQLQVLDLHNCPKLDIMEFLSAAKTETKYSLETLELSHNTLDHDDLHQLWDVVSRFPKLTTLNLTFNRIGTLNNSNSNNNNSNILWEQPNIKLRNLVLTANPVMANTKVCEKETLVKILLANPQLSFVGAGMVSHGFMSSPLCSPRIRQLLDLNHAGRGLFCCNSSSDYSEASSSSSAPSVPAPSVPAPSSSAVAPLSLWPIVLERAHDKFQNFPKRRSDVIYQLLHGPAFACHD
jgi:hypothetical protein